MTPSELWEPSALNTLIGVGSGRVVISCFSTKRLSMYKAVAPESRRALSLKVWFEPAVRTSNETEGKERFVELANERIS